MVELWWWSRSRSRPMYRCDRVWILDNRPSQGPYLTTVYIWQISTHCNQHVSIIYISVRLFVFSSTYIYYCTVGNVLGVCQSVCSFVAKDRECLYICIEEFHHGGKVVWIIEAARKCDVFMYVGLLMKSKKEVCLKWRSSWCMFLETVSWGQNFTPPSVWHPAIYGSCQHHLFRVRVREDKKMNWNHSLRGQELIMLLLYL